MSISAISSSGSSPISSQTSANPLAQDMKTLQSALQQGNTSTAQTAFASLEKDLASSPGGTPAATSPLGKALQSLSTALQSGSASTAQTAFSALQTAMKTGHHHHRGGQSAAALSGIQTSISATSTTGTTLNVLA
jgi:outer membrane protein assembly factor BamD (BamD/ComL family)